MELKTFCIIMAVILIIISMFCLSAAFDKKDNYRNSEYFTKENINAYVGGDAYNYIINSNYFVGYIVLAVGCLISATIFILAGVLGTYSEKKVVLFTPPDIKSGIKIPE